MRRTVFVCELKSLISRARAGTRAWTRTNIRQKSFFVNKTNSLGMKWISQGRKGRLIYCNDHQYIQSSTKQWLSSFSYYERDANLDRSRQKFTLHPLIHTFPSGNSAQNLVAWSQEEKCGVWYWNSGRQVRTTHDNHEFLPRYMMLKMDVHHI